MKKQDLYHQAHLFVAAIRLIEHRQGVPPTVEQVCEELRFYGDRGNMLCRRLEEMGVITIVKKGPEARLFIQDHLKLEDLQQQEDGPSMLDEIERFKTGQDKFRQQVESIKAQQAKKQKDLFAEIEAKLKGEIDKKKKP